MFPLILLILLIIISICILKYKENFEPISHNQYNNYEQSYKSDTDLSKPVYYSQLDYQKVPEINCCLVEKKYLPSPDELYEGNFKYVFTKKSGEQCNSSEYNLNSNIELLIDGENNWSNSFCSPNKQKIGSCRNINKECIDFVDKEFCDKYRMKWTTKTCHQPTDYTWVDPINLVDIPRPKGDGTFIMF